MKLNTTVARNADAVWQAGSPHKFTLDVYGFYIWLHERGIGIHYYKIIYEIVK